MVICGPNEGKLIVMFTAWLNGSSERHNLLHLLPCGENSVQCERFYKTNPLLKSLFSSPPSNVQICSSEFTYF